MKKFLMYLLPLFLFLTMSGPASADWLDVFRKLVGSTVGADFSKQFPPIVLTQQEEDELVDSILQSYKNVGQEITRQQAAIMAGLMAGYTARGVGGQGGKVAQPAPGKQPGGGIPAFDIAVHCKQVASLSGGSYMIEESCMDMERAAKAEIAAMTDVPERVMQHCARIAQTGGQSYSIMQSCIAMELQSKRKLEKR